MNFNKFQKEVSHIWKNSSETGNLPAHYDHQVNQILHQYAHEIGLKEREGYHAQVALAWGLYKKEYGHMISGSK